MGKVRAHELRVKAKLQLTKQLEDAKKELSNMRTQQHTSSRSGRIARIGGLRKDIARILTVMNQDTKSKLRKVYAEGDARALPKDMRVKATRAIRKRLTPAQAAKMTVKATKKAQNFPKRVYAVKA